MAATRFMQWLLPCLACLIAFAAEAAVLPEDRVDYLRHKYDGGGMEIKGPSVLVRKSIGNSVSLSANHYVDKVSSASIDVITAASRYEEERTEKSLGLDYLHNKSILSMGYTRSEENDYLARSFNLGISQDFFGDLTTLTLGYSRGIDKIGKRNSPEFQKDADRRNFRFGLSQILTKNLVANFGAEIITDEGFLNNPYRSVRYIDPTKTAPSGGAGYSTEPEIYPGTRTSHAYALRARYFLPWRAALGAEINRFSDTWEIRARTHQISYSHPIGDRWIIDARYRRYQQTEAEFYSDLFPYQGALNFMARDKELSRFNSTVKGIGISFIQPLNHWMGMDKFSINWYVDKFTFDYKNFRDLTYSSMTAGTEPLYGFDATVTRIYFSLWY